MSRSQRVQIVAGIVVGLFGLAIGFVGPIIAVALYTSSINPSAESFQSNFNAIETASRIARICWLIGLSLAGLGSLYAFCSRAFWFIGPAEPRRAIRRASSSHAATLTLLGAICCAGNVAFAQDAGVTEPLATEAGGGIIVADLEQQLTAGLKLRRDQEKAFVDAVISLVEQKRLPVSLVKSVFHWSRRKNPKVPYPYFERAMRLTAEKIGVEIVVPTSS